MTIDTACYFCITNQISKIWDIEKKESDWSMNSRKPERSVSDEEGVDIRYLVHIVKHFILHKR